MSDFDARKLTWAALLGRWVELAQAAVALPDDADGRAWRAAVPDVIGLQALAMALGEADALPPDERALGLDRARLLIERHTTRLAELFPGDRIHPMLTELADDARAALTKAEALDRPDAGDDASAD